MKAERTELVDFMARWLTGIDSCGSTGKVASERVQATLLADRGVNRKPVGDW
jgi:hypothetical protein